MSALDAIFGATVRKGERKLPKSLWNDAEKQAGTTERKQPFLYLDNPTKKVPLHSHLNGGDNFAAQLVSTPGAEDDPMVVSLLTYLDEGAEAYAATVKANNLNAPVLNRHKPKKTRSTSDDEKVELVKAS